MEGIWEVSLVLLHSSNTVRNILCKFAKSTFFYIFMNIQDITDLSQ